MKILSTKQKEILNLLKKFKSKFILVGGTAIALQIGHRQSIDFDLFYINKNKLYLNYISHILAQGKQFNMKTTLKLDYQRNLKINGITVTFYAYPYNIFIGASNIYFQIPDLLDLASMKAFAIGQRAKWKDYVDLFFLIQKIGIIKIIQRADILFGEMFNKRLFLSQLTYFKDIDYSEEIEYMDGFQRSKQDIQDYLTAQALDYFKL